MNYYPHHLGDYAADTRHLSMLEHGAYRLLIDTYYTREAPLPADGMAVCRLVVARSDDERQAVLTVLREFFTLTDAGWSHARCDAEIARMREKSEKARQSVAQRRDRKPSSGAASVERSNNGRSTNVDGNGTNEGLSTYERSTPNSQEPTANNQERKEGSGPVDNSTSPTLAGQTCRMLKEAGVSAVNPSDAGLMQLLSSGVTPRQVADLAVELKERRGEAPGFRYVLATMIGRLRDAAEEKPLPKVAAGAPAAAAGWQRDDRALQAMGQHLGMQARPGEDWPTFRSRVAEAVRRRQEQAA